MCVCVWQKELEREGALALAGSLTHTLPALPAPTPSCQPCGEERTWESGLPAHRRKTHRQTGRQLFGYRGHMGGGEDEQVRGGRGRLRTTGQEVTRVWLWGLLVWLWGLLVSVLAPPSGALV